METIDTYIVRIYRRDLNEPRSIAGLVEIVGSDEKKHSEISVNSARY